MILTVAAIVAQASPAPSPSASPTPQPLAEDPKIDADAKNWFTSLIAGKVFDASQMTDNLRTAITPDTLKRTAEVGTQAGALKDFAFLRGLAQGTDHIYVYKVTLEQGNLAFIYALDPAGKVDGMWIKPIQP